jgi:succinyl-CoA synthetase alpha subunit
MRRDKVARLLINVVGPKAQEVIVTFLDKIELRREIVGWIGDWGYGFLKGYRKGREGVLLEQLAARFGKLPAGVTARIKKADHATLAAWTVEVLTAETLERVFEQGAAPAAPKRRATARKRARRA